MNRLMKLEHVMPEPLQSKSELTKEKQELSYAKDMRRYFWTVAIVVLFVAFVLWYFS